MQAQAPLYIQALAFPGARAVILPHENLRAPSRETL